MDVQTRRQVLLPPVLLGLLGSDPRFRAPAEIQNIEAEAADPKPPEHKAAALKMTRGARLTEMLSAILPGHLLLSLHSARLRFRRLNAHAHQEYRSRHRGGIENDGVGELSGRHYEPACGREAAKCAGVSTFHRRAGCEGGRI